MAAVDEEPLDSPPDGGGDRLLLFVAAEPYSDLISGIRMLALMSSSIV